jgi:hypothetical protein
LIENQGTVLSKDDLVGAFREAHAKKPDSVVVAELPE